MPASPVLMLGDCLERMEEIADGSVDLVLCDPPYGTVGGMGKGEERYARLAGSDWDVALDPVAIFEMCNRKLRVNGVLVMFSQEPYTSRLIVDALPNMPFCYRLVWLKDHFANCLLANKAPVSFFEDVVVFAKRHTKHDFGGEHPLRDYAEQVIKFIGKGLKEVNSDLGHRRAEHFFYVGTTQFGLCTDATYGELCDRYGLRGMEGFREFDDLAAVNTAFRADLIDRMTREAPKVFNLPPGQKYKSNVLQYRKDYDGFHPTQKPVALLEDLIRTYSNEGDTVLDFTMGSGSTGVAALKCGRQFIGIEREPKYFEIAQERMAAVANAGPLFEAAE